MLNKSRILAPVLMMGLVACQSAPRQSEDIGDYTDASLSQQGEAAYRAIIRNERLSNDIDQSAMALCVTTRLVEALTAEEHGGLNWEVTVFDKDIANAFALPGGKMGVYAGLFRYARNDSQLAAVMAHEVGHVLANHASADAGRNTLRTIGRTLAQLAGMPTGALLAADLAAEFGLFAPFSRAQESEADALGLMLMARAGFDPEESVYLWRNMNTNDGFRPPEFISTHPSPDTRIEDLQARMGPARALYEVAFLNDRVMTCRDNTFL